jgi:hypothetical protein
MLELLYDPRLLIGGAYLVTAILVGFLGIGRKLGAWGYFYASILLTPVIGILLLFASDKRRRT